MIATFNSNIIEQQLLVLSSILKDYSNLVSKECLSVAVPFLCQHYFPPCDSNGNVQFITQQQCINIREEVCLSEWRLVMATELGSLLPVCEAVGVSDNSTEKMSRLIPPKCHYQFKEFCGVCLPLCGMFSQYPDQIKLIEKTVIIIAAVMALIGGILVFIASTIRRKEMQVFHVHSYCAYVHTYIHS